MSGWLKYMYTSPTPNPSEFVGQDFYAIVKDDLDDLITKGKNQSRIGNHKRSKDNFDKANEYLYFLIYLYLLRAQIVEDTAINGVPKTKQEYIDLFKLECIRKTLGCSGKKFNEMLLAIGWDTLSNDNLGGINFMSLDEFNINPFYIIT